MPACGNTLSVPKCECIIGQGIMRVIVTEKHQLKCVIVGKTEAGDSQWLSMKASPWLTAAKVSLLPGPKKIMFPWGALWTTGPLECHCLEEKEEDHEVSILILILCQKAT